MESVANVMLLDADGRPLDPQIQAALRELLPRFRHRFLTLRDEFLVTEIFEEAGRRIQHEAAAGRVGNLGAYAWRTLRNVAVTRLRHSSLRLERATLGSHEGEVVIGSLASRDGTAEQIEANIELDEFLSSLTPRERQICLRKKAGCTSREIAMELGTSPGYVDKLFNQIRRKFEDARDRREGGPIVATSTSAQPTRTRPDVIPSG